MRKINFLTLLLVGIGVAACGQKQAEQLPSGAAEQPPPVAAEPACSPQTVVSIQTVEIAEGLSSKTFTEGCGDVATNGQIAVVHYTGWLFDADAENHRGEKFDSSRDRDQYFEFPLGGARVIKGWDQGIVGMQVGEIRELTIAPALAYGDRNMGAIPPGSTLVFEVELAVLKGDSPEQETDAPPASAN